MDYRSLLRGQYVKFPRYIWTLLMYRRRTRNCLLLVVYSVCVYTVWNISFLHTEHSPVADSVMSPSQSRAAAAGRDVNNDVTVTTQRRDVIVHVTWFYPPNTSLRFHEAMCLLAVQRYVRPRKILLWYDAASTPPTGAWWQFARQSVAHLLPVPYQRPTSVYNRTLMVPEHQSDVVRLTVLEEFGGLYVDLDVIIVRPVDSLLSYDVIMGAETPMMLGSGFIFVTRTNATFIRLWRQAYADNFDDSDWNRHSVYVPMELAKQHPNLIHVEWFSINRPNWNERQWLYTTGKLWDWSENYAVHLWYREHPTNIAYDPLTIRHLNTTTGEVLRLIYYENPRLLRVLPPVTNISTIGVGNRQAK